MITVFQYKVVDSTNLQARRLFEERDGASLPFAVVADEQSAGLGRAGRGWSSPHGGLWMSLAWPSSRGPEFHASAPLVVGLAASEVFDELLGIPARVKWPNDIMVGEGKLAGILCQSGHGCLIAGIGVNGNYPSRSLHGDLRVRPATLQDALGGRSADLVMLRTRILERLEMMLTQYQEEGFGPFVRRLGERLTWVGESVYSDGANGTESVAGVLKGIDEEGRLILLVDGAERRFVCGELSRLNGGMGNGEWGMGSGSDRHAPSSRSAQSVEFPQS